MTVLKLILLAPLFLYACSASAPQPPPTAQQRAHALCGDFAIIGQERGKTFVTIKNEYISCMDAQGFETISR